MSKKIVFLFCLFAPLFSYAAEIAPQKKEVGRYQMVSHDTGHLYLLDTATGQVWRSETMQDWYYHDTWVPQITSFKD